MEGSVIDQTTQLADVQPHFDTHVRVALSANAPPRTPSQPRDKYIGEHAFSPAAVLESRKFIEGLSGDPANAVRKARKAPGINMDHDAGTKTAVRDFNLLALSSKRAGKKDVEANAYVSLGVIYDNQKNYKMANDYYKLYLALTEEMGDVMGSACACNCLGVNYALMASPPSDAGTLLGAVLPGPDSKVYLEQAIFYHTKHLEIGPDAGGRFVSHTNLGLCHGLVGDIIRAAKHHQDALRTAIQMQTLYGQSIAVGNLGMLALVKTDFQTARTCFEQHLQLVQTLSDPQAEVQAWIMISKISNSQGSLVNALESLERARAIAERERLSNELRRIHCLIGISAGEKDFMSFLSTTSQNCKAGAI